MPNWCINYYSLNFRNKEYAKKAAEFIQKCTASNELNTRGQGFGVNWLGNFALNAGWPYHYETVKDTDRELVYLGDEKLPEPKHAFRGDIIDWYIDEEQGHITIETETAYEPMTMFIAIMLEQIGMPYNKEHFENVDIRWCSEEPGLRLYAGSDPKMTEGDYKMYLQCPNHIWRTNDFIRETFGENVSEWEYQMSSEITVYQKEFKRDASEYLKRDVTSIDMNDLLKIISSELEVGDDCRLIVNTTADKVRNIRWLTDLSKKEPNIRKDEKDPAKEHLTYQIDINWNAAMMILRSHLTRTEAQLVENDKKDRGAVGEIDSILKALNGHGNSVKIDRRSGDVLLDGVQYTFGDWMEWCQEYKYGALS